MGGRLQGRLALTGTRKNTPRSTELRGVRDQPKAIIDCLFAFNNAIKGLLIIESVRILQVNYTILQSRSSFFVYIIVYMDDSI